MLKILIDSGNAPAHGGIGIYSENIVRALRQYYPDVVEVRDANLSSPATSFRPIRRLIYFWRLHRLVRGAFINTNVIHFTNYYVPRKVNNVTYVGSIHDLDPIMLPSAHTSRYVAYFKLMIANSVNRAKVIITDTEAVRSDILNKYSLEPQKVRVAGIGLSPEFIEMVDNNTQSGSKVPTLLFVGQINRKKNIPWLVNSVVDGVQSGALPQLRLILAGGKGYGFSEVEKVLKNVKGIVQWYPNPPLIDLVKMYCECTALVLPSLREGFGIPLLEAMYCGKPIIASKIPSTIEVAGEGPYYFSLGSKDEFFHAVRSALDDNNMQQRQLIYSNQLDRYSWKKVVNDYMRIYKEADSYK